MKLIDKILSEENLKRSIKRVKSNKGAPGVDKMTVDEIDEYFKLHKDEIITSIMNMKYKPQSVRRVYIPKPNGKKRPLGIPTVKDRVIQQAIANVLVEIYEPIFSNYSYGFRPKRCQHDAMHQALEYLKDGYEWIVDLDIEKYFDTVNHDKLISILREQVKDKTTLHLIRSFLRAGIMDGGLTSPNTKGMPQGGPLSPVLSNIYLDKFDKELEERGLRFVRFADDCNIFVKSEMSANRVMKSVTWWLERKLFLKVSATKTKVVGPRDNNFLGFKFVKMSSKWELAPSEDRKARLYKKAKKLLVRKQASAKPLAQTFKKINSLVRGWINYFRIGKMKIFIDKFGQWLRHKIRVIILKQWKKPKTIYRNLQTLNKKFKCNLSDEEIYKVANSRLGLYRSSALYVMNYLISPTVLANEKEDRPGLINPLVYYLR